MRAAGASGAHGLLPLTRQRSVSGSGWGGEQGTPILVSGGDLRCTRRVNDCTGVQGVVRRSSFPSAFAVCVRAAKAPDPLPPSSSSPEKHNGFSGGPFMLASWGYKGTFFSTEECPPCPFSRRAEEMLQDVKLIGREKRIATPVTSVTGSQ